MSTVSDVTDSKTRHSKQKISTFALVVLSVAACIYGYVGYRLISPLPWGVGAQGLLSAFLLGCFGLGPAAVRMRLNQSSSALSRQVISGFYLSFGLVLMLFCVVAVRDIGWLLAAILDFLPDEDVARSLLLHQTNLGVVAVVGVLAFHGNRVARGVPRIKRVQVPIKSSRGLPEALFGFKIVQLSDIHIGPNTSGEFLERVVERTNTLDADVVVITGDLVDGSVAELWGEMGSLSRLKSTHGTLFITGNHEYYSGVKHWVKRLPELGLTVLLNQAVRFEHGGASIKFAGTTDASGHRFYDDHSADPAAAVADKGDADVTVLLAHQPKTVAKAQGLDIDLQLSGHTHGGQIFPFSLMVRLDQPVVAGLERIGDLWIYVSRGTGFWGPPLRVFAPSEITVLELV